MELLKVGDEAPEFVGIAQSGVSISLTQYRGKRVILYFYPKDNTPGCTLEACNLRDNHALLLDKGFVVIGVSADNENSHQAFISRFKLPFPLIADTDKKIINLYGVWGPKKFMGRTFDGINRTTFVISKTGIIEAVIEKVKNAEHAQQILQELNIKI